MPVEKILNDFRAKFRIEGLTIYKNNSWTWSLRPAQPTLGAGILSLNRYAVHLSDLSEAEMKDLRPIIIIIEKTLKESFQYDIMNYLMLMMVDHHVHYHVIPRYKENKMFGGLTWLDNGWPGVPVISDNQHQDLQEILEKIRLTLQNKISLQK